MKAFVRAISYYLPEHVVTNETLLADFPEWSVDKVALKIGVNERHVASDAETSVDLAVHAAQKLCVEHSINPSNIDFVLLCTQSPDYFLPTSACLIQDRLGLPLKSGALDINLGCSGFIYGLALAKGLIVGGIAKNVLLLTSETYSKYIHPKDKSNRTIFGDAAAATLISTHGFAEILNFSLGTDGGGAGKLIVKTGGCRFPSKANDLHFDETGVPISSDYLFMEGTEIMSFTLDIVPTLVDDTLELNSINMEDVDVFIFHQANKYMLDFLRRKIKIPEDKFFQYMWKVGNTVSSTIPIALNEAINEGKIKPGKNILLAGFGVGYSWGATILRT